MSLETVYLPEQVISVPFPLKAQRTDFISASDLQDYSFPSSKCLPLDQVLAPNMHRHLMLTAVFIAISSIAAASPIPTTDYSSAKRELQNSGRATVAENELSIPARSIGTGKPSKQFTAQLSLEAS